MALAMAWSAACPNTPRETVPVNCCIAAPAADKAAVETNSAKGLLLLLLLPLLASVLVAATNLLRNSLGLQGQVVMQLDWHARQLWGQSPMPSSVPPGTGASCKMSVVERQFS